MACSGHLQNSMKIQKLIITFTQILKYLEKVKKKKGRKKKKDRKRSIPKNLVSTETSHDCETTTIMCRGCTILKNAISDESDFTSY